MCDAVVREACILAVELDDVLTALECFHSGIGDTGVSKVEPSQVHVVNASSR